MLLRSELCRPKINASDLISQGGASECSELTNPKSVREKRSTVSEREWRLQTAETFSRDVVQRAERDWPTDPDKFGQAYSRREPNAYALQWAIFASFAKSRLARLASCFDSLWLNPSKIAAPKGATQFCVRKYHADAKRKREAILDIASVLSAADADIYHAKPYEFDSLRLYHKNTGDCVT